MILAIPSTGRELSSFASLRRIDRVPYFLLINEAGSIVDIIYSAEHIARKIVEKKPDSVIIGQINSNDFEIINDARIQTFSLSKEITVLEVFNMWKNEELEEMEASQGGGWGSGSGKSLGSDFGGDKGNSRFGFNRPKH